jgi:hypothetical protein
LVRILLGGGEVRFWEVGVSLCFVGWGCGMA